MTDEQIIKAIGICRTQDSCKGCPYHELYMAGCVGTLMKDVFDLINRQKAEIEKLKQENDFFRKTITENAQRALEVAVEEIEKAKSEAIKEFAERLKEKFGIADCIVTVNNNDIDELIEEMTEENKSEKGR